MKSEPKQESTLVILGATGDLTRRLLFPAIYRLFAAGRLQGVRVVGYAVEKWTVQQLVAHLDEGLRASCPQVDEKAWAELKGQLRYISGDLSPEQLGQLTEVVPGAAMFYLALPPQLFGPAAEGLGKAGLANQDKGWRRLIVEKPFGWDLASARKLREQIHTQWEESQVLRIDHFLGKETTQNLLVFRLANRFLEPIWNTAHISEVQITVAETLGLEGRWRYYDDAGALRDMLQNHLMQLFTLTALEPPARWDAEMLRDHKVEVLKAVRPIPPDAVDTFAVRGQYTAGTIKDKPVPGYREEEHIPDGSRTETFAAIKLYVDNWRWKGVTFTLRSGKRLAADHSEIAVRLREVPTQMFGIDAHENNWLIFHMKPDERIDLVGWAKKPGLGLTTQPVVLSAEYAKAGEVENSAYEQLLMDAISGDRSHFLRFDEVEESWRILEPVLEHWKQGTPDPYPAGSEGPETQARLPAEGHRWRSLKQH